MNIFLTGGTGFIGSYILHALVDEGHHVTVLARNLNKVPALARHPKVTMVSGSLADRDAIKRALGGQEACIHVALGWGNTAVDMLEADTLASVYIMETAAQMGASQIIYTSSTAAYGEHRNPFSETVQPLPMDFYGATKAATENYLNAISHVYKVRSNTIRPGYTFGNPVVEGGFIYSDSRFRSIVAAARANQPIPLIKNDGTQFIWAADLAKIYVAVLTSEHDRQVFNGLGAEFVTWEEIAVMAIEATRSTSEIVLEDRGWARGDGHYDVSRVDREFGYRFLSRDRLREHVAYLAELGNLD